MQVGKAHVPALYRQTVLDSRVLLFRDLHYLQSYTSYIAVVLTRPRLLARMVESAEMSDSATPLAGVPGRLPSRVDPIDRESPYGYLCRVTGIYRYGSPKYIGMLAGLNSTGAIEREDRARRLAYTLRIDFAEWKQLAYMSIKGDKRSCHRSFFEHIVGADRLNYCNPRVCSSCLKMDSIAWGAWDLGMVSACPIHRCLLIDHCPGCGRHLNKSRPAVHECRCGFDLRAVGGEPAEPLLLAINAAIYRAAGFPYGQADTDIVKANFEPSLASHQLDPLLRLICFAGSTQEASDEQRMNHRKVAADVQVAQRLGSAAGAILSDWPHRFHAMLRERMPRSTENPVAQSLRGVFGLVYGQMSRSFSQDEFAFIHKAFEAFILENWIGVERGKFFSNVTREDSRWVSAKEVAGLTRSSSGRVAELVRCGELKGVFSKPKNVGGQCWISRRSLNCWLQKRDSEIGCYVSNLEASKILGLHHTAVFELARAGLIRYQKGSKYGFPRDTYFHGDDIARIKHAFERHASPQDRTQKQSRGKLATLQHGLPIQFGWERVLSIAIRAVLDGTLVPVAHTQRWPGIKGFLFRAEELARIRPREHSKSPTGEFITVHQAATLLGTTTEVIRKLIERHFLSSPFGGRQGAPRWIPVEDVRAFAREYVAVSVLAERFHTSCPWVHRYLNAIGIEVLVIHLRHQSKLFAPRERVSRVRIPLSARASVRLRREDKRLATSR